jgi:ribosome-binding ATPase YchF (GTP1/OBG family)
MKIGILGFPQCGKKTLFQLLTGIVSHVEGRYIKPVPGTADIRDARFDVLVELYNPRKRAPAQILMELLPDLDSRVMKEEDIFKDTANFDAIFHVVRVFQDDTIYHVNGSIDPGGNEGREGMRDGHRKINNLTW